MIGGSRSCPICGAPNGACGSQRLDLPPVTFADPRARTLRRMGAPRAVGRGWLGVEVVLASPKAPELEAGVR